MGGLLLATSILIFRVGVGIDRVSARYIVQENDTVYLDNDVKCFIEQQGDWFSGSIDLSTLALSGFFNLKGKVGDVSVSSNSEVYRYHDQDTLHLNHALFDLDLEYNPEPIGFRLSGKTNRYSEPNQYFQDLNGVGGAVFWGYDRLNQMLEVEINATVNHVPDSLPLSNIRIGPEIDFYLDQGSLIFNGNLSARRVRYKNQDDNRWESDLGLDFAESLSDWFGFYEEGRVEVTRYDMDDEINYDQQKIMLGLGPELQFLSGGRFRIGPRLRYEKNHPLGSYHDFVEGSLYLSFELVFGGLNIFIENEYGRREYDMEFYVGNTNYRFNELSAMGDASILKNLELQVFTSYGPEWHTVPQDNSTFFMLSTRLAYRF